ncbi:MAG: YidC/Oxa1 family membrane protein insertase [Actinobacteria bacterium]|nr:YidC/Oxa1 family membrane protein insertase [Actinomycetota bacterium]
MGAVPWSPLWQGLLDGIGWVVARIYDVIPNYGVTIIALTVLIRLVLLPLGIKQIKSMQAMQAIQPKVKVIQQKYKGNRQKAQEETMKLYKEHNVNPFSGCWPVLLQFPILIAMYSVLRQPSHPPHLPPDSALQRQINLQIPPEGPPKEARPPSGTDFLWTNLLCSAIQSGNENATLADRVGGESRAYPVECGSTVPERIPYYVFAVLMFGTTYFQQRQMQRASPPGSQSQQQQTLLKIMPLMFGVFGFTFPAGLVVYWTTSNIWQIGQQYFMLKAGHIGPGAAEAAARTPKKPGRKGFIRSMMDRAEQERARREAEERKPSKPGSKPSPRQSRPKKPGSGGSGAGSRKKRPKR